jgi:hypothetical protein
MIVPQNDFASQHELIEPEGRVEKYDFINFGEHV